MNTQTTNTSLADFIWKNADDLWGNFKHVDFGKVILPFTLLRRLECVLEPTRDQVRETVKTMKDSGIDLTIKFFARDDSGNTSAVTSIDVKVNNGNFVGGGDKPYSVNPTLGKRVSNGGIVVDGANNSEWGTNNAVALDMADALHLRRAGRCLHRQVCG